MNDFSANDLKKAFNKESSSKKAVLVAAVVALVSSFLPWISISFGSSDLLGDLGSITNNGWVSWGYLTIIASFGVILLWVLPKVGVKFKLPVKEVDAYKILSAAILAGPVLWIIASNFDFGSMGIGFYLALLAGGGAVYVSFFAKKKKASTTSAKKK